MLYMMEFDPLNDVIKEVCFGVTDRAWKICCFASWYMFLDTLILDSLRTLI